MRCYSDRLYYKKNVVIYAIIGVSMHLLFDFIPTLWPRWGHAGMMLFFPFSSNEIALHGIVPYSLLIGVVSVILLMLFSLYALLFFVKKNEYPWMIWIDERRILDLLMGQRTNK